MAETIRFIVQKTNTSTPKDFPVFVLSKDSWDDYGHKIKFHLRYFNSNGNEHYIGSLKILHIPNDEENNSQAIQSTELEPLFFHLEQEYISLGQNEEYYLNFRKHLGLEARRVLSRLNDIAVRPERAKPFEDTTAFRNALMRENGAQRARRFGLSIILGEKVREGSSFSYVGAIEGAATDVEAHFDFNDNDVIPGRIVAIIGRNAVGKTRFLASLAEDLAQISRTSEARIKKKESRFPDGRPLYTRVIAISYSAFDRFKRPSLDSAASYIYCGIRNDKGSLSLSALNTTYRKNLSRIRDHGLEETWVKYMSAILGDLSNDIISTLKNEVYSHLPESDALSLLSSGQSILVHLVSSLLAWIQPNSLVLFDEPETHLHPNAVASLFLTLSKILKMHNSYAIVATHSPVVIQEVPAKRVIVFQREENLTTANTLEMESFGESVTELTKQVFETNDVESVYRGTLKRLSTSETINEVLSRFELGLSLSAQAYLLAQYAKKAKGQINND